jgi:hypothetical protein
MGSVDTASRKYERLDFVALIFHVRTHLLENQSLRPINNSENVLAHDPTGTNLLNCSKHFGPQVAFILCPLAFACERKRLAQLREPSGKDNVLIPPEGSVSF